MESRDVSAALLAAGAGIVFDALLPPASGGGFEVLLTMLVTGGGFDALFRLLATGGVAGPLCRSLTEGLFGNMMRDCVCMCVCALFRNVWK